MRGDRYKAEGPEAEFEPGSRGRVLRNRLGIYSARKMAAVETFELVTVTEKLIDETGVDQRFTAGDIRRMHNLWLGNIYVWAGEYRQVNMGKDGFMFAAAAQVPRLMHELERGALQKHTPCAFVDIDQQARALAIVHAELVLIHPFRDGNGRCARLLATLMALQAGLPALDFGGIRGKAKQQYVAAIHAALSLDYAPMIEIFRRVIIRTLKSRIIVSSARGVS